MNLLLVNTEINSVTVTVSGPGSQENLIMFNVSFSNYYSKNILNSSNGSFTHDILGLSSG